MGSLRLDKASDYAQPRKRYASTSLWPAHWRGSQLLLMAVLLMGSVFFLYPFVWMVSTSVKENIEVYSAPLALIPHTWRFDNYVTAFTLVPFGRFYLNTIIMTVGRVVGQLFLASMAAYAFARIAFPGRNWLFVLVLTVMMVPSMVTVIPRFILIMNLGWLDTFYGLIIPGIADAFGVFLLRQFFLTLPQELLDAAEIDGCNPLQSFIWIALPLSRPVLAAYGFLITLWTWNDFLWPLIVVTSTDMHTISVGIQLFQNQYSKDIAVMMAAASISILPMLILFVLAQRFIVEGIAKSGLKL